jgi:7-carboxy-7-deazaguanine synthase
MKVHSIFQSINGEVTGSHQGSICTFIRLQGCNLQCSYCDTIDSRSTKKGKTFTIPHIIKTVGALPIKTKLLTITGGEPLLQRGINDLIESFYDEDYEITIETNGTICPSEEKICNLCHVIMDCKLPSSFSKYESFEEYIEKFMENSMELLGSSWIKFPIQNKFDFEEALLIMEASKPSNPQFAFSAIKPLTPKELLEWMFKEKISKAVLNIQLHKLIGTA